MADCIVTCFERVLHQVQEVSKDKVKELSDLYYEEDINKVLEFGIKNDCFTKSQAQTLYDGIVLWKDNTEIISDDAKKNALFKAMGDDCPYGKKVRVWITDAISTCYEKTLNEVKECPEDKLNELYEIITEDGLREILDFGIENKLFTERQGETLYDGIIMWEDLDGNYYEEDEDKFNDLLDKMGVEPEKLAEWQQEYDR